MRTYGMYKFVVLGTFFLANVLIGHVQAEEQNNTSHLYQTWEGMEPDKGASAWLIKRYIDPKAYFKVQPYGEELVGGVAFDVPEAHFRRTHRWSTFETLVNEYKITDKVVKHLGLIIHDIEINTWGQKKIQQTPQLEHIVNELRRAYGEKMISIDCYIALFDALHTHLTVSLQAELDINIPSACTTSASKQPSQNNRQRK